MTIEEIKKVQEIVKDSNCIEVCGRCFMRNEDGLWQSKEALDYVYQGGENTYAKYSDEAMAQKFINLLSI